MWQILMRTSYDDDDSDKVGIIRLLSNGVFKDAYPLHDGRAMKDDHQKGHHCSRRVSFINFSCTFVNFKNANFKNVNFKNVNFKNVNLKNVN